jgi:hypothetical protein
MRYVMVITFNVSLAIGCVAQVQPTQDLCRGNLRVKQAPGLPLVAKGGLFSSEMFGSYGSLEFVNRTDQTIRHYLIMVELLTEGGEYLFTVPVVSEDKNQNVVFDVSFKPWLQASAVDTFGPIKPHQTVKRPFFSQLAAPHCPAVARTTLVLLQFADGMEYRYGDAVNVPPMLLEPIFKATEMLEDWTGTVVNATISVDAGGHATLEKADSESKGFYDWLQQEIPNWRFTAALQRGRPSPARLQLLLVISAGVKASQLQGSTEKKVLVVSIASPTRSLNGGWQVYYGKEIDDLRVKALR